MFQDAARQVSCDTCVEDVRASTVRHDVNVKALGLAHEASLAHRLIGCCDHCTFDLVKTDVEAVAIHARSPSASLRAGSRRAGEYARFRDDAFSEKSLESNPIR